MVRIIDLPDDYRYLITNVFPLALSPGPTQPANLQSLLKPLINEINTINNLGKESVVCHDQIARNVRIHIVQFTGDLPAIRKVGGLAGHNCIITCRFCTIRGTFCRHRSTGQGGHYYYTFRRREGSTIKSNPTQFPLR